jgi:hypothetical protein
MESIISATASLLGVLLGAGLTSLGGRRAAIRSNFKEARMAVAYAHAAHSIYRSDGIDGNRDEEFSRRLLETMVADRNAALLSARRALSTLSVYSRAFEEFAWNIAKVGGDDFLNDVMGTIDREESRALRPRLLRRR